MTSSGWADMPEKPNRFYKNILTDVGSHTKLQFPEKFLRIVGKNLKDSIMLNAPRGLEWSIDLERSKGKVWLQNGWPEFAEFYSIRFGYLVIFEYKGDSKFQVLIFDPSSLEIDYPLVRNDKPNFVKSVQVQKRSINIDVSSTSDDSSNSGNVVRPCKKTKTKSTTSEASGNLQQDKAKAANRVDKDRALASAKAFKSKNPFFIHVIKESHTVGGGWPNVYIPRTFKETYVNWENNEKVVLHVATTSWPVSMNLQCNQCRLSRGWTIFARANSLHVGDVCVFELIDRSEKLFQVFIYRAAEETNCDEYNSLPRVTSEVDKARVLAIVEAFKPKEPHFTVKVNKCYLYGNSMTVPKQFIEEHITKGSCNVLLQVSNGIPWSVKCYIHKMCAKFSAGWKKFSQENNLAAGDVCGFELVNQAERLFNVVIFRKKS